MVVMPFENQIEYYFQVVRPLAFGVDLVMHSCTKVTFSCLHLYINNTVHLFETNILTKIMNCNVAFYTILYCSI